MDLYPITEGIKQEELHMVWIQVVRKFWELQENGLIIISKKELN